MNITVAQIKEHFNYTDDLSVENFTFKDFKGKLVYLTTMVDNQKIEKLIYLPLKYNQNVESVASFIESLASESTNDFADIVVHLLKGSTILLSNQSEKVYLFDTLLEEVRSPEEPDNEKTVRGAHLGFVEDLSTNIHMIRNRIKNEQLKITYIELGEESIREIAIIYMENLANKKTVTKIKERLESITLDTIFAPGYIEECIEEQPISPFPQNLYTERPDRVEAHLMEGRVAVMSDNNTDAIILPVTFFSFFQSPDDYNNRFYAGTVFRLLRLFSFIGTLLLPPTYIALVGFHFEIIPYELITLVKSSMAGVPFPPFFEALFMAITVELIREAGIRLPTPIGETIGIVGGLIISDAVVNAGLVSNVMVIAIALTAIMSFTIPSYEMGNTVRIINFPIMIAASLFGFVGIVLSLLFIIIHLCKIESFGVPYLSPVAPLRMKNLGDAVVRLPIWKLTNRPYDVRARDTVRQGQSRGWMYHERKK